MTLHISQRQYQDIQTAVESAYPQEGCGVLVGKRVFEAPKGDPRPLASPPSTIQDTYREVVRVIPVANAWKPGLLAEGDNPQGERLRSGDDPKIAGLKPRPLGHKEGQLELVVGHTDVNGRASQGKTPRGAFGDDPSTHQGSVVDGQTGNPPPLQGGGQTPDQTTPHGMHDRYWIDPTDLLRIQHEARDQGLEIIGIYHSHPDHPAVPSDCDRRLAWPVYSYVIAAVHRGHLRDLQSWRLQDPPLFESEVIQILAPAAHKSPAMT